MNRRAWLLAPFGWLLSACCGLDRYHSRVKFSLSTTTPRAGKPFRASIDYMDDTEQSCAFVLLQNGAEVDRAALPRGTREVTLTATSPGPHAVELRWDERMIAHRNITVAP